MDLSAPVTLFPCRHHAFCQGHLDAAHPEHGPLCPDCFAADEARPEPAHTTAWGELASRVAAANDALILAPGLHQSLVPLPAKAQTFYPYPIRLHVEYTGVRLSCLDISSVDVVAEDVGQVIAQGVERLKVALALYVKRGRNIPLASVPAAPAWGLQLPVMTVAKILLWNAMCEARVSRAELARRLGCSHLGASRLVDLLCDSKIATLERALGLLGRRMTLVWEAS